MRKILRVLAILLALATVTAWMALGAHRGWTHVSETRMEKDPVTEIDYPVVKKRFRPGLELLGAGLIGAAAIGACSLFFRNKPNSQQTHDS